MKSQTEPPAWNAPIDPDREMENPTDAICAECSAPFTYDAFAVGSTKWTQTKCETCIEKQASAFRDQQEALKLQEHQGNVRRKWERVCPPRFLSTNLKHPDFRTGLYEKVMAWEPTEEKPWLGMVGGKGCCKSRIAVLRMKPVIEANPITTVKFLPVYEFAEAVQHQFSNSGGEYRETLQGAKNVTWLVLDDIGKAKATEAVVAALFALLDHRYLHNRFTIWTANSTPEEVCEGMPNDVSGPLVRRLKEISELFAVR